MNPILSPTPAALALALLLGTGRSAAQAPERELPKPVEFVHTQDDSLFSLTRSQEDIHALEQALAELERGEHEAAVERLHKLLQEEIGGVVAIGPDRYLGLRHAVVLTLANLSPAASAAYEQLVRREAGSLPDRPLPSMSQEQLELLAERFPAAASGRAARLRLGDLAFEAGDGLTAARHFRAAFDAAPFHSRADAAAWERLRLADALVRPRALRDRPDLPAAVGDVLALEPPAADRAGWPAFGGGPTGCLPMWDPVGQPRHHDGDEVTALGFDYGIGGTYAMQPVGDLDAVFIDDGLELQARDPLRGELLWSSPSPLKDQGNARSMRDYGINQNMVLAAACDGDVVVAALQVPDDSSTVRYQNAFTIMSRLPERRLFGFQRSTGKLLWAHFDQLDGTATRRFRGHSACGPPLILGDTVYAPVYDRAGAIAFYVGAYDLRTGEPRWRRLICSSQQEVNMFGNARMEFAASPLCAHDGLLYGSSNLGVCFCIGQTGGRVHWITSYECIRMPPTQLHGQDYRPVFFQNSAPIVHDGVFCCTPLDSAYALGIDCETGRPLWRLPHDAEAGGSNDVRWLFGAADGEFLFAGAGVVAVPARPPAGAGGLAQPRLVRSREFLRSDDRGELPRPAMTGRWIYYPGQGQVSVFDTHGNPAPDAPELRCEQPGNLLLVDGIVVSLCNRAYEVLLDADALRAGAEARLRAQPGEPSAILRLCRLRRALDAPGDDAAIEKLYRDGLAACIARGLPPDDPLRATFQRQLFETAMDRARVAGPGAAARLRAARDLAPDAAAFLRAEGALIAQLDDPAVLLQELDVLLARAGDQSGAFPDAGGTVPVPAYVLWRRARLLTDPAAQVACWQQLLEQHGAVTIQHSSAAELANDAIKKLLGAHGRAVYAAVEARAAAALAAAGNDSARLRALTAAFPNSEAAATALTRLLDLAVTQGDLGSAIDGLAIGAGAEVAPGLLRRVLEAARLRGNRALARAMADRLRAAADRPSDWPGDEGRTYGAVLAGLEAALRDERSETARMVPAEVLAALPNPGPRVNYRALTVVVADGFVAAPHPPLYVSIGGEQLRAIDLDDPQQRTLFTRQVGYLEGRVWLCGPTLLVCSLDALVALDYRSGAVQWHLPSSGHTSLECLGVVQGVLQLTLQDNEGDRQLQLLGLEPLTGRKLYDRPLPAGAAAPPKPTATDLLLVRAPAAGAPAIDRLDPLTGRGRSTIELGAGLLRGLGLRPEVLASRLFPQTLAADGERVFLAVDGTMGEGLPRVVALRPAGADWTWTGNAGRRILVSACRGDRLLVVEAATPAGGRALVLDAATGNVRREVPLGNDVQALNWQRLWLCTPAPPALLCADLDARSGDRRLVCIGVDDGWPSFVEPLGGAGEDVAPTPWLDRRLLVYGQRSRERVEPLRLFALHLEDRSGAMPDGGKSIRLPGSTHEMSTSGAYTVVVTERGLFVLGERGK